MNKFLIILGIVLVIIAGIVFFQFRSNPRNQSSNNNPSATVKINNETFKVEVADNPESQQIGLSNHESLPKNQGMLFLFEDKAYHTFWMKNMNFPIDIIFINDNKIVSIAKNAQPSKNSDDDLELFKPSEPINRVFEINAGLADEHNIKEGDAVEIKLEE